MVVLVLLLTVACAKAVPDETANLVIKDLSSELARLQDASVGARTEKLNAVCTKHGVDVKAFARYVADHPDVEEKLLNEMLATLKADLAGVEASMDKELKAVQEAAAAELEKSAKAADETQREVEVAAARELGEAKKAFEEQRNALLKELAELQQVP
jgi:hypothetical protein